MALAAHRTFAEHAVAGAFGRRSTVGTVSDIHDVDAAVGRELELLDPVCHQATVVPGPTGEAAAIARVDHPVTEADVEASLRAVGVMSGSTVIVHCSLSELGWVIGNAVAVVRALRSVVGDDGTIVMPAQTGLSDPSHWQAPPVPESWWPTIRANWPAFDPMITPLRGMGVVAECFARLPGVVHSGHPAVGFIAQGPRAADLMDSHDLHDGLGDRSPLASLEVAGADIVLIGVGHGNNTALHLAEMRALGALAPMRRDGVPMLVGGQQRWVEYSHVDFDESDFVLLGDAYSAAGGTEMRAPLGAGEIRRLPMREVVAFGTRWIAEHRLQPR